MLTVAVAIRSAGRARGPGDRVRRVTSVRQHTGVRGRSPVGAIAKGAVGRDRRAIGGVVALGVAEALRTVIGRGTPRLGGAPQRALGKLQISAGGEARQEQRREEQPRQAVGRKAQQGQRSGALERGRHARGSAKRGNQGVAKSSEHLRLIAKVASPAHGESRPRPEGPRGRAAHDFPQHPRGRTAHAGPLFIVRSGSFESSSAWEGASASRRTPPRQTRHAKTGETLERIPPVSATNYVAGATSSSRPPARS